MTKTIGELIEDGTLPVFPITYAQEVVGHAALKAKRGKFGKQPSMPFLDEWNPRKALELAKATLKHPDGVIRERLRNLRQYLPGQQDIIYDFAAFVGDYANAELVPQGFVMTAALALHDFKIGINGFTKKPIENPLARQPIALYRVIEMMLPTIAKAVFPSDFADGVKETVDDIHEITRQKWEAAKAAAPKPTINGDPFVIYTAARKIADLSFSFYGIMGQCEFGKATCGDRRKERVNPFFHQTTGGLFFSQYYGGPGSIWTPWGKWGCWGGGSSGRTDPMKDFLAAIGEVELYAPAWNTDQGTFGPVYAIKRVGDIELPKPELREKVSYLEYEDANRQWEELTAKYESRR